MKSELMNSKAMRKWLFALAVPAAIGLASPAHAVLVIDDYNTTGDIAVTATPTNNPVELLTSIDASNIVWGTPGQGNKQRRITANLSAGDSVSAEICSNCQAGHHTSGPNSGLGRTTFEYSFADTGAGVQPANGTSVDASGETHVMLDYVADVAGAEISFVFQDASTGANAVSTGPLGGGNVPLTILLALPGGVDYSQLAEARIEIAGVAGLDATFDNFKLTSVPEPMAMGLFGIGLAGLAFFRRRRMQA